MKLEGHYCDLPERKPGQEGDTSTEGEANKLQYCVTDVPPWYLCILLGIQVGRQTTHTHTHTRLSVSQPLLVVLMLCNMCMLCCMFWSFGFICCSSGLDDLLQSHSSVSLSHQLPNQLVLFYIYSLKYSTL